MMHVGGGGMGHGTPYARQSIWWRVGIIRTSRSMVSSTLLFFSALPSDVGRRSSAEKAMFSRTVSTPISWSSCMQPHHHIHSDLSSPSPLTLGQSRP